MSKFSSSDSHSCGGAKDAEVRGGFRLGSMSLGLSGLGGAGPERPFLLVWVLGGARAV